VIAGSRFMRRALTHIQTQHYSSITTTNRHLPRRLLNCCSCATLSPLARDIRPVTSQFILNMSSLSNGLSGTNGLSSSLAIPGGPPLRVKNSLSKEKVRLSISLADVQEVFKPKNEREVTWYSCGPSIRL